MSEVGILGRIARDGQQILRFRQCGDDTTRRDGANLITIAGLNAGDPGQQLFCFDHSSSGPDQPWYRTSTLWNPTLGTVDFLILQTSYGGGDSLRHESKQVLSRRPDGSYVPIYDLGPDYQTTSIALEEAYSGLRPDGQALVLRHDRELVQIDREGTVLARLTRADFDAVLGATVPPPNPSHSGYLAFAWTPDGQQFAVALTDCTTTSTPRRNCGFHVVVMNAQFEQLRHVSSYEARNYLGLRRMLWSPDGSYLAGLTRNEADKDELWIISLATGATQVFSLSAGLVNDALIEDLHWIR